MRRAVFLLLWAVVAVVVLGAIGYSVAELHQEFTLRLPLRVYTHEETLYHRMRCPSEFRQRVSWLDECRSAVPEPEVRTDLIAPWVGRVLAALVASSTSIIVLLLCLWQRHDSAKRQPDITFRLRRAVSNND